MRGGDRQNSLGHVAGFFSRNTLLKKGTKNCSAGKKTEPKNRTKKTKPTFTVVAGDDTFRVLVSTKDGIHAEKIFSRLVDGFQLLLTGFFCCCTRRETQLFVSRRRKNFVEQLGSWERHPKPVQIKKNTETVRTLRTSSLPSGQFLFVSLDCR